MNIKNYILRLLGFQLNMSDVFKPMQIMVSRADNFLKQVGVDEGLAVQKLSELQGELSTLRTEKEQVEKFIKNLNKLIF